MSNFTGLGAELVAASPALAAWFVQNARQQLDFHTQQQSYHAQQVRFFTDALAAAESSAPGRPAAPVASQPIPAAAAPPPRKASFKAPAVGRQSLSWSEKQAAKKEEEAANAAAAAAAAKEKADKEAEAAAAREAEKAAQAEKQRLAEEKREQEQQEARAERAMAEAKQKQEAEAAARRQAEEEAKAKAKAEADAAAAAIPLPAPPVAKASFTPGPPPSAGFQMPPPPASVQALQAAPPVMAAPPPAQAEVDLPSMTAESDPDKMSIKQKLAFFKKQNASRPVMGMMGGPPPRRNLTGSRPPSMGGDLDTSGAAPPIEEPTASPRKMMGVPMMGGPQMQMPGARVSAAPRAAPVPAPAAPATSAPAAAVDPNKKYVEALHDLPQHADGLKFKKGDRGELLSVKGEWAHVRLPSGEGFVPCNFFNLNASPPANAAPSAAPAPVPVPAPVPAAAAPPPKPAVKKCKALFQFVPPKPDGFVPLVEGEVVEIAKGEDGEEWWLVRGKNGETGYVPSNYVQRC